MTQLSSDENSKLSWFENYTKGLFQSVRKPPREDGSLYPCPCCGYKTLSERGGFKICPVCFWEDDGQDDAEADLVRGGPNYSLSLTQARANFERIGACEKRCIKHVRAPRSEEK